MAGFHHTGGGLTLRRRAACRRRARDRHARPRLQRRASSPSATASSIAPFAGVPPSPALRDQGQRDARDGPSCCARLAPAPMPIRVAKSTSRFARGLRPVTSSSPASARRAPSWTAPSRSVLSDQRRVARRSRADRGHRAAARRTRARVAMRINPDVDAGSHPHISTGHARRSSACRSTTRATMVRDMCRRPACDVVGLHVHVGSQITRPEPLARAAETAGGLARELIGAGRRARAPRSRRRPRHRVRAGQDRPESPRRLCRRDPAGRPPTGLSSCSSPAAGLSGPAGVLVTEVVDLKRRPSGGWFVIVDAGMTDLIRPALYGAWHAIEPVAPRAGEPSRATSSGRCARRATRSARPRAAARRGRRPAGRSRHGRLRGRHGLQLQSTADGRRGAGRRMAEWASFAGGRRSTTCCSGTYDADRVRRTGPERQGNAGAPPARADRAGRPQGARRCRFPTTTRRSARKSTRRSTGEREFGPDVMQLLYVANRFEYKPRLDLWLAAGDVVVCDRYRASSVAYGEAQGLDPAWLEDIQRHLPQPDGDGPARHRAGDRGRAQGDGPRPVRARPGAARRVRESYRRQAASGQWVVIDGEQAEGRRG